MALRGPALVAALLAASGAAQETETPAGVCLLQKSPSQTHKVGRLDLTAVSAPLTKVHGLLDRHNKITMLIQQGGRRSGHAVHEAHSTVGKAIKKLRKSYESLADIAAAGGSRAALHTALLRVEAPAKDLKKSLDLLEGVCLLQKHASKSERKRQARSDLAALSAAYDNVHRLLDRHDKITMRIQQGGRRPSHAAKQAHSTVGKAIKKLRQSSESVVGLEAAAGSPKAMHTLLLQIEAPTKELKSGLDHLEEMIHEVDHAAKGA